MKQTLLLLALLLCLLWPSTVFADDGGIGVQLNSTNLQFTDAAPLNQDGRIYVPFRAVFEALDATVTYDQATSTITAQKGDTHVTFVIGNTDINVDGKPITTDAASFVRDGRTYVPVRFAAQSFGATVGWDGATQTVVMVDQDTLKKEAKDQYTLMDQYLAYSEKLYKEPVSVTGTIKLDMKVANEKGTDSTMIPVQGTMALSGITTKDVASVTMKGDLDLAALQDSLEKQGELTDENKAAMEQAKQFEMQLIVNQEQGKVYLQSPLFGLHGMDGTAWYQMDLDGFAQGKRLNLSALPANKAGSSYESYVMELIDSLPVNDSVACAAILQTIQQYQDKNFQKIGNQYVASGKQNLLDAAMATSMTLQKNGNGISGYQQAMTMYQENIPVMTWIANQTGKTSTISISLKAEDAVTMELSGTMAYTNTDGKPQTAPPAGAKIVDMAEKQ